MNDGVNWYVVATTFLHLWRENALDTDCIEVLRLSGMSAEQIKQMGEFNDEDVDAVFTSKEEV